jgi:hypothetical protein
VTHLVAGLGAGFFAVCVGSPVDVVKSRVMGERRQASVFCHNWGIATRSRAASAHGHSMPPSAAWSITGRRPPRAAHRFRTTRDDERRGAASRAGRTPPRRARPRAPARHPACGDVRRTPLPLPARPS